jgi:hypothetical protein
LLGDALIQKAKPTIPGRAQKGIPHPFASSKRRLSMPRLEEAFNRSGFSLFINSPAGRIFRVVAGLGFLVVGYVYRGHTLGVLSMVWSVLPLSAGALDLCYISALLGGPLSGAKIRARHKTG